MKSVLFILGVILFLPGCIQGEKTAPEKLQIKVEMVGVPITAPEVDHVHVLEVAPGGEVYMGLHDGVAVSYDGGESWREIKISEKDLEDFMALAVNPDNPRIIYAGGHGHGVWKSEDGGKTWRLYDQGLPAKPDVHALSIDPTNPDKIYALISGDDLYVSEDGGKNWRSLGTDLDTFAITTIAVDVKNPRRLYVGGTGTGVLVSDDGGKTWSKSGDGLTNLNVVTLASDQEGRLYAGTKGGIFKSEDGGRTWKLHKELSVGAFDLNPSNPSFMVVASKKGFYKSTDGGFIWSVVFETEVEEHKPAVKEEELIIVSGPADNYRPNSWGKLGRDVEGNVTNPEYAFDQDYDDTTTYATVRAQGCDSNFAAVYEWTIKNKKGGVDPVLYYHWSFEKEVDRASIGAYNFKEDSWEELYAIVDKQPMKKKSLRIPERYINPGGVLKLYFEVVTPCSVGEMHLYDVYLTVPR